jgi:uncharacterized protein YuzE
MTATKHSYLEVTYCEGRPYAAYYYLPRQDGDSSIRVERADGGLLVDYASDGRPIGIEITSPSRFDLRILNEVLAGLGPAEARPAEFAPLEVA